MSDLFGAIGSGAASSFGKGMSLSHEKRTLPGTNLKSPVMDEFGNFYRLQDEYEDSRQVRQQLALERSSFEQKMALAREQGIHPLSILGVPLSTTGASNFSQAGNAPVDFNFDTRKHDQGPSEYDEKMMGYNERIASANARSAEARATQEEMDVARMSQQKLIGQVGSTKISNDQIATQSRISGVPSSAISVEGGPIASLVRIKPSDVTASVPGQPGTIAGVSPLLKRVIDNQGSVSYVADQNAVQSEIDEGALFNALLNHGVSVPTAMDIIGFGPYLLGALGGVGMAARRLLLARNAGKAAKLLQQRSARKRWKGGD